MSNPPPPPPGGPPPGRVPQPGPPGGQQPETKSFWKKLFDLDFTEWVTPSVAKVLYVLAIILASLYAFVTLIVGLAGLSDSNGGSIILVILAPLLWLLFVVYSRVIIEVFLALIRTAQNTRALLDRGTD
jgi:hypothetical protein